MKLKLLIILTLISINGFSQETQLLKPLRIIYYGINNKVKLECKTCDTKNVTITLEKNIPFELTNDKEGFFLIKPLFENYHFIENRDTKLYVIDKSNNDKLDSISILIKKLPTPNVDLIKYGHNDAGSWIRFDSLAVLSDLYDELGLQPRIDSFEVKTYYRKDLKNNNDEEDFEVIFIEKNIGNVISDNIKGKILELNRDLTIFLLIQNIYISVEGLKIKIESNLPFFILKDKLIIE